MTAERPGAVHDHGVAGQHRREQRGDLRRRVFLIGVAHDHVVAGGGRSGRADRGALAPVAVVHVDAHPRISLQGGIQVPAPVGAPIVDNDEFCLAGEVGVEDLFDHGRQGGELVVNGHKNRQLHGRPAYEAFRSYTQLLYFHINERPQVGAGLVHRIDCGLPARAGHLPSLYKDSHEREPRTTSSGSTGHWTAADPGDRWLGLYRLASVPEPACARSRRARCR